MNFSEALTILKLAGRVRREGWNGKGMFIFLVQGSQFEVNRPPLLGIYPAGTIITYHAHIDMKTADGTIVPWVASQTDILAIDWEIVSEEEEILELPPIPEEYKVGYTKKDKTYMYPYEIGMSMQSISVTPGIVPEVGDMIAFDPYNTNDRWLITKDYLEVHYNKD